MIITISSNDHEVGWGATGDERIVENVRNILRTRKFEVPFMRDMGLNPNHSDAPPNYVKANITNDIIETINTYESRAKVVDVNIVSVDENGYYEISVDLEV